jgi:hypothetical protein
MIKLFIFIKYNIIILVFKYILEYLFYKIFIHLIYFLIIYISYTYNLYTNHIKFIYYRIKYYYIIHHYTSIGKRTQHMSLSYQWLTLTILDVVKLVNVVGTRINP